MRGSIFYRLWQRLQPAPMFSGQGFIKILFVGIPAIVYALVTALARAFAGSPAKLQRPVISVGSPTVGGAGKTPCVIALAQGLINRGARVGIVGSGYRRTSDELINGPGRDVQEMPVTVVGDEISMMARRLPDANFAVANSKRDAAETLAKQSDVDCIIIDDGLQTQSIYRDCDIVLLSSRTSLTDLFPLPLGKLRLPMSSLKRARWLIVTKLQASQSIPTDLQRVIEESTGAGDAVRLLRGSERLAITADSIDVSPSELKGRALVFSGLAENEAFVQSCREMSVDIAEVVSFPDHHSYSSRDWNELQKVAANSGAGFLLTTEKDWTKIRGFEGRLPVRVVKLDCELERSSELIGDLVELVKNSK